MNWEQIKRQRAEEFERELRQRLALNGLDDFAPDMVFHARKAFEVTVEHMRKNFSVTNTITGSTNGTIIQTGGDVHGGVWM